MATLFFDSSAIVKRYIREPGTTWMRELCNARDEEGERAHLLVIAQISRVEVAAAFAVLVRRKEISSGLGERTFQKFANEIEQEYQLVRLTPLVLRNAAELTQRHPLKAYDAVQLSACLEYNESLKESELTLTFVSGDETLLQAARAEGLATDNPFQHADLDKEHP
ncbi:MAG: type II toxin-antitoxin system VapC family toxin [Chloroflexota bacterium]|nr:type II toxin-antitoxin system VapC family toxin [Chloroflexota bacterium]